MNYVEELPRHEFLGKKARAPADRNALSTQPLLLEDIPMMQDSGTIARIRRAASIPSIRGIYTSINTTSGRTVWQRWRASTHPPLRR